MKSHKIGFKFSSRSFSYTLPFTGVDLQFLKERKLEILDCMKQLAERTTEINIASKEGVVEFDLANELVKYYFYALLLVNNKEKQLLGVGEEVGSSKQAVYMYKQTRERTR